MTEEKSGPFTAAAEEYMVTNRILKNIIAYLVYKAGGSVKINLEDLPTKNYQMKFIGPLSEFPHHYEIRVERDA